MRKIIGIAINSDNKVRELHPDEPLLGERFKHIVIFRSSEGYDSEYVAMAIRCRLEVGGTWVELP